MNEQTITLPRKKHSHRCKTCNGGVYCYKSRCQLPQRLDICDLCQWRAQLKIRQPVAGTITPVKGGFQITHTVDPLTGKPWEPGEGPR